MLRFKNKIKSALTISLVKRLVEICQRRWHRTGYDVRHQMRSDGWLRLMTDVQLRMRSDYVWRRLSSDGWQQMTEDVWRSLSFDRWPLRSVSHDVSDEFYIKFSIKYVKRTRTEKPGAFGTPHQWNHFPKNFLLSLKRKKTKSYSTLSASYKCAWSKFFTIDSLDRMKSRQLECELGRSKRKKSSWSNLKLIQ